ncbi:MAG: sensor histidine kinase, partial [Cyanobacteria bacterium]|nr:sensor histidine kinase [Cyanobacteriota bacterium]
AGGAVAEILANLLENAFRYSPIEASIGLHCVALASDADGGAGDEPTAVSLSVWDAGPAIAVGERQRIFERGARGRDQGTIPGSGLGLALARDLARRLGGDLELVVPPQAVDPALPDEGNAFRLTLPAPPPASTSRPTDVAQLPAS